MIKHTKIVATVSDQRCDVDFIEALFKGGMNVVRLNSAHMDETGFNRVVGNVRQVSNSIGILMDTKGPEIRMTITKEPIAFKTGDRVKVMGNPQGETTKDCICVSYPNFVNDMHVGDDMLIDDGELEMKVVEKTVTIWFARLKTTLHSIAVKVLMFRVYVSICRRSRKKTAIISCIASGITSILLLTLLCAVSRMYWIFNGYWTNIIAR